MGADHQLSAPMQLGFMQRNRADAYFRVARSRVLHPPIAHQTRSSPAPSWQAGDRYRTPRTERRSVGDVAAAEIRRNNHDAIAACERTAMKARKANARRSHAVGFSSDGVANKGRLRSSRAYRHRFCGNAAKRRHQAERSQKSTIFFRKHGAPLRPRLIIAWFCPARSHRSFAHRDPGHFPPARIAGELEN